MEERSTIHVEEARVYLQLSGKQMEGSREEGTIHAIVSSFLDWESYPVVHGHRTFDMFLSLPKFAEAIMPPT